METTSTTASKTTTTAPQQEQPGCKESSPILRNQKTAFVLPSRCPLRRVHFAPALVNKQSEADSKNVFASPHKELTKEMIHEVWYSQMEILTFQKRIKLTLLLKERFPTLNDSNFKDSMLGLDRHNPKRASYKRAATKFTLEAQQKSDDPDFLALVSRQCSSWAKSIAIHSALKTCCDVYDCSMPLAIKSIKKGGSYCKEVNNETTTGGKRPLQGETIGPATKRQRCARAS
ncbi:unnamed protein product [Cylindrotheca closterium]|uniref:Uncharacterized protein n=1 Tax=Cylindrotheca closterium TaxID=2856 RepID=A0AAD2G9Z9_9STRA|nr:unnamed protein product [Cylindrotheca closterium]